MRVASLLPSATEMVHFAGAVDANSYFSRPAPRLVEGVEVLARILHPEAFGGEPTAPGAMRLPLAVG
ncbi:MAG TPA: hypothetical protein VK869_04800 [Rubrobacteraceae bacterium]|nr:hypothetical protein [Rubrobacteraceae bacterium]